MGAGTPPTLAQAQEALDRLSRLRGAKKRLLEAQDNGCWHLSGFSGRPALKLDDHNVTYSRWLLDRFDLIPFDARSEDGKPTRVHPDCKNPRCVNPAHYLVPPPGGGKQGRKRLNYGDLRDIRVAHHQGRTTRQLANYHGITMATVRKIVGGHGCYDE